jgi:hypothetical protein
LDLWGFDEVIFWSDILLGGFAGRGDKMMNKLDGKV